MWSCRKPDIQVFVKYAILYMKRFLFENATIYIDIYIGMFIMITLKLYSK